MPVIHEQVASQHYQYISPAYVRGMTFDGKSLHTKSVVQTMDGTLHVQMQLIRYPSEEIKMYSSMSYSAPASPPTSIGITDPALTGLGLKRAHSASRKGSGSEASQDGRSVRSISEECTVMTDGEDADGEAEDDDEEFDHNRWMKVLEQRSIVAGLARVGRSEGLDIATKVSLGM